MRKIIYLLAIVAILSITNVSMAQITDKSYIIEISNSTDGLVQSSLIVSRIKSEVDASPKEARATLYSFTGEELATTNFNLPVGSNKLTVNFPYYNLGKEIKIISNNTSKAELLVVDVAPFAKTCEDGTCQEHESYYSCPADCKSGSQDRYCDSIKDDICDPDCNPARLDADCMEGGEPFVPKPAIDTTVKKIEQKPTEETEKSAIVKTDNTVAGKKPNLILTIFFGAVILIALIWVVASRMKKESIKK